MKLSSAKGLALVIGLATFGCGVQVGPAGAQGTMPPGSYTCQPLSEESFLESPPFRPPGDKTPEEQEYADSMKLPPDLCPTGMIAYPVPIPGDIASPGNPAKGNPLDVTKARGSDVEKAKVEKTKAKKARAKLKKAKAKARRKKAKAKAQKRRLARARAASCH